MSESANETARRGDDRSGHGDAPAAARPDAVSPETTPADAGGHAPGQFPGEVRGPKGPEPTRFGDWEKAGRCYDF